MAGVVGEGERFAGWLRARQSFVQARALLVGLTGCTQDRAGQAIVSTAQERHVPVERVAADFLESIGTSDPDAEKLLVALECAAIEPPRRTDTQDPGFGYGWAFDDPGLRASGSVPIEAGGLVGVTVTGELDLATAPMLRAAVNHTGMPGARRVFLLDLSGLTFLDAVGLRALGHVHDEVAARGDQLRVAAPVAEQPRSLLWLAVDNEWLDAAFDPPDAATR